MKKLSLCLAILALALPSAAQAQQDLVFGKTGTPTRGQIKKITKTEVVLDVGGVERTFEVRDIVKVTFGDEPTDLSSARNRVLEKRYEDALEDIGKIDVSQIRVPAVRQDIEFFKAVCNGKLAFAAGGNKAAAAGAMVNFLNQYKGNDSFHYFEAAEMIGDIGELEAIEPYLYPEQGPNLGPTFAAALDRMLR